MHFNIDISTGGGREAFYALTDEEDVERTESARAYESFEAGQSHS